jgi:hypothetical protein
MIKKTKPVFYILIQFLFLQSLSAQKQTDMAAYISQRFSGYCKSFPYEEIFIQTDREEYIAGEDLWFNAYITDKQSLKPALNSRIVYFEILNSENKPVVQKRIRAENGFGPGQIELPDSLAGGTYLIRAYTSWMKNFLPLNCFMKEINIYNAFNNKTFTVRTAGIDIKQIGNAGRIDTSVTHQGLTLIADNLKPGILELVVITDEQFRRQNNDLFYLFIQTRGLINHVSSEKTTGETTKIVIPKTLLSPGINHITVFDSKGLPICERLIYTPSDVPKEVITLHSSDSYGTRSKVIMELEIEPLLIADQNTTNLSISVAPAINTSRNSDFANYLLTGTEFGFLPAKYNGRKLAEIPPEELDSLLSNMNNNWINWKTILSPDPPEFRYNIENEDHQLNGYLLTRDDQLAFPGEYLLMSTPGKNAVFQYAATTWEAYFSFSIPVDEELKDLLIQTDDTVKKNKIYIESSFPDRYLPSVLSADSASKPVPSYISKWSVNYQVGKIYDSQTVSLESSRIGDSTKQKRFYGKPDLEIIMKDYIKLPTMEEVFFELIPHVTFKNNWWGYEISFMDISGARVYEKPPTLMIDGVIIKDPSIIAKLDPELVEKIDIVRETYCIGAYKMYGIVNIITKSGNFSNATIPASSVRLQYKVTEPVRKFVSPDYTSAEMKDSRTPDFRNTLYWNPAIKSDKAGKAKIEFWTSDVKSDYEINIQGITSEGKTISVRKLIKVK